MDRASIVSKIDELENEVSKLMLKLSIVESSGNGGGSDADLLRHHVNMLQDEIETLYEELERLAEACL